MLGKSSQAFKPGCFIKMVYCSTRRMQTEEGTNVVVRIIRNIFPFQKIVFNYAL